MSFRRFFPLLALVFTLFSANNSVFAQHEEPAPHQEATEHAVPGEKKKFNVSDILWGHIADSHYWHLFDWNGHPVAMPLPVIIYHPEKGFSFFSSSKLHHGHESYDGYRVEMAGGAKMKEKIISEDGASIKDISITKNVLSMLISVVLLLWVVTSAANKYKANGAMKAPSGFQNFLESVIIFLRDEVAIPNLGKKWMTYMPLLLTVFFFIWINNLLGLLPGGANFTGNIAVTACLALVSFIVIMFSTKKYYWGHIFNPPGVPLGIKFLVVPIEIMSIFIKPIALMIRLFANMMAGHIVILSVISMIFIFGAMSTVAGWGFAPISVAFSIFMFMLELLVAAIQAFIFANLTAVFIGQAIEEHHHEEGHADGHH